MRVVIVPFGSHGDVHPFVGLGRVLRDRGHRVVFVTNDAFRSLIEASGFEASYAGSGHDLAAALRNPDLWHPTRGMRVVLPRVVAAAVPALEQVLAWHAPGETVLVGSSLAFGARLAQELTGAPLATVHLAPSVFHSDIEPPVYGGRRLPSWSPLWFKRAFFNAAYRYAVEPHLLPGLNAARAGLGLPPVSNPMRTWLHSPDRVLALFPDWFGPPLPDWPPGVVVCGFPLYDERDVTPVPPSLDAFLAAGPPPLAFTPGTANVHGRPFFEAAVDACARLGARGLLLTRFSETVPANLPDGVIHVPFAPFGLLLPRVAALVHHGGIGTAAQAMAAGVPQLVMPMAFDQSDNAARMERLGVARSLGPSRFRGPAVADRLRGLTTSPEVARRCREVAARCREGPRPLDVAADAVEALFGSRAGQAAPA